jgi:hypothetical protein
MLLCRLLADGLRQRFADAQKKLELLNDELVILRKAGVAHAANLAGGMVGWRALGLPE